MDRTFDDDPLAEGYVLADDVPCAVFPDRIFSGSLVSHSRGSAFMHIRIVIVEVSDLLIRRDGFSIDVRPTR